MQNFIIFVVSKYRNMAVMPAIILFGLFLCPCINNTRVLQLCKASAAPHPRNITVMVLLSRVSDFDSGTAGAAFFQPAQYQKQKQMHILQIPLSADLYQSEQDCIAIMHANASAAFSKLEENGVIDTDTDLKAHTTVYYEAHVKLLQLQRQGNTAPVI